jgi:hypothetical protein
MTKFDLFYPAVLHMIFTLIIYAAVLVQRNLSVLKKKVSIKYYVNYTDGTATKEVITWGRHLSNQFELPILFYAAVIMHTMVGGVQALTVILAWGFLVARIIHSMIHMSYNNVVHRMAAFALSWLCAVGVILSLVAALSRGPLGNLI